LNSYSESIRLLLSLEKFGMKFGLGGITRLLETLENPHRKFATIHIAGTNGKGSVASMLAAFFTAAGYRTGLYTSPDLVSFTERIRIDGKRISQHEVARYVDALRPSLLKQQPTFFEATTAIAFAHFAEKKVEIAVIEAGLGGRLDSTNVVRPLVSVITNIGLEHTEVLGDTIERIAGEKAGIIKNRVPCVTGVSQRRALAVIRATCEKRNARLILASRFSASIREMSLNRTIVDLTVRGIPYERLQLSLPGSYQLKNAALAIAAIQEVKRSTRFHIAEWFIRLGLSRVQELTGLDGRLSLVRRNPRVILDVAHNADGARMLAASLQDLGLRDLILVFGAMKDKNCGAMARALEPFAGEVITVAARTERSRSAGEVAGAFAMPPGRVTAALSVQEGVRLALQRSHQKTPILITGSHFIVGEAKEFLAEKKNLTISE
jgi:dihydrofolate synthase/folylpolyglutamate synthase